MSLQRPRRIFRGTSRSAPLPLRVPLAVSAAAAACVGLVLTVSVTTDLFGRAPPAPDHVGADARDVAVVDGTTLRMQGRVVRLRGVEAPERGTGCAAGADCGAAATRVLATLVRNGRVECRLDGRDPLGRPWAVCEADGRDLGAAMVGAGWARTQDAGLRGLQDEARRRKAGLWATAT